VLKLNRENTQLRGENGNLVRQNQRLKDELDSANLENQLLRAQIAMLQKKQD
jgi:hypothetical protein